jgi:DNA polymerase elongation subunit (family B)
MRVVNGFYSNEGGQIMMYFVKQDNGQIIVEKKPSEVRPYFYTKEDIMNNVTHDMIGMIVDKQEVEVTNGKFIKWIVHIPFQVKYIRDYLYQQGIETFEADILFFKRYMIDTKMDLGNERLNRLYFDIETDNPKTRFPKPELDHISFISCVSEVNGTKEEKYFYLGDYNGNERTMLYDFMKYASKFALLCGWNIGNERGEGFDIPFMVERMKILNIDTKMFLSCFQFCDLMGTFKSYVTSYSGQTIESYALDYVSEKYLGKSKVVFDEALGDVDISSLNKEQLIEYGMEDARLCYELDKKLLLSDIVEAISLSFNVLFDDAKAFSRVFDVCILRESFNYWIHRCKPSYGEPIKERYYRGAYVQKPISGVHKNVVAFDFKSLYPNIIQAFNISFETIGELDNKVNNGDNIKYDKTLESDGAVLTSNGKTLVRSERLYFRDDIKGILPKLLVDIQQRRDDYKKKMVDEMKKGNEEQAAVFRVFQIGLKFISAAIYGYLGYKLSRIYDERLAESITLTGQKLIKMVISESAKLGYQTIISDTDSAYIKFPDNLTLDELLIKASELEKILNVKIKEYVSSVGANADFANLRYEKVFNPLVCFAERKKRYYGKVIWEEGVKGDKLAVTGYEKRRGDWCILAKNVQETVMKMVVGGKPHSEIKNFVSNVIINIDKFPVSDYVFYKSVTRPISDYNTPTLPLHTRLFDEANGDFVGVKIGFIVTDNKGILQGERYFKGKTKSVRISKNYYRDAINHVVKRVLPQQVVTLQHWCR